MRARYCHIAICWNAYGGKSTLVEDHYLKVFVRRLRNKLGDDAKNPHYIQTEWGVGYRFVPPH